MTPTDRSDDRATRVYSSDSGRIRPELAPARPVPVRRSAPSVPNDGVVRVSRTSSGRGGKTVTLITGLPPAEVAATGKELKRLCGTGGTIKDGVVEIQGDHRQRIVDHLAKTYTTKLAGG